MTVEQMTKYLSNILSLETKLYEIDRIEHNLQYRIDELEQITKKQLLTEYDVKTSSKDGIWKITSALFAGAVAFGIAFVVLHLFRGATKESMFLCGIVAFAAFGISFAFSSGEEAQDIDHYKKQNEYARQMNIKIKSDAQRARFEIGQLEMTCDNLDSNYNLLSNTLNNLYAANLIYPKYRNLVAVASFYEYFSSGRCTQLQGHEGAYNIYENELIGKIIIGKLDDILYRLDEIRSNQYMLYNELMKSNQKIDRLTTSVNAAVNRLEQISKNQELIAYNTEIAQKNTEIIKWISVYGYVKN